VFLFAIDCNDPLGRLDLAHREKLARATCENLFGRSGSTVESEGHLDARTDWDGFLRREVSRRTTAEAPLPE